MTKALSGRLWLAAIGSLVVTTSQVAAQEDQWRTRAELGASVFFGNTSQTAVTSAASAERTSPVLGVLSRAAFTYGEGTDEQGIASVNKRAWNLAIDLSFDPEKPFNVFVRGKTESIFEKKIELRYNGGVGGKYQFLRSETGRAEFSLAVLSEKTIPRDETGRESTVVGKWASRFYMTRALADGRITFESETSYEPEFDDAGVFILNSKNSLAFQLSERLALQFSFVDQYDSEAKGRGARTNNDGQLFFSVVSTF
jgi:Protein of unknown function, DUF481